MERPYVEENDRRWTQWLKPIGATLFGLACIGAISGSGWYMSYSTASASLESAGKDFMENIPLYIEASLEHRLDPIRFHLMAGLDILNAKGVNVSTWEGISQIRPYSVPFLKNFFGDTKCCYGVAINMGFDKADVAPYGGWQQFLDAHPHDWGDDRMVSDVSLMDKDANGTMKITAVETYYRNGSATNNWWAIPLDTQTYQPLVPRSAGFNFGFIKFPWLDITWKTVHINDLQPGEFHFTPIIMWNITQPNCLKTHGVVPLYENTRVPTEAELKEFKAGRPPWNPGRRVGAWIVGFKLWFLSQHLASINLRGGFVYLVERASGIFVAACDTSLDVLRVDDKGDRTITIKPIEVDHALIQGSASKVAPDGNWAGIAHTMQQTKLAGTDQFLLTFGFKFYGLDLVGVYIVPRSVVLAELDSRATRDAASSIVLNTVFSALLVGGVVGMGAQSVRKVRAMAAEAKRAVHRKIQDGLSCASELAHPMVLISMQDFWDLDDELLHTCHEGIRQLGLLRVLDTPTQVDAFKKAGNHIVLFSYEWLSWVRLGPTTKQFEWMKMSLNHYAHLAEVPLTNVAVWLDILSIPQTHPGMKALAVNSLYVFAASSSALIIIAPDAVHEHTGLPAGLASYQERVWTRVEQVAMLAANGVERIYVAKESGIEPVEMQWLEKSLCIFDGNMTCCRRNHEHQPYCDKETIVLPVLGLWFRLLAAQRGVGVTPGALKLYELYMSDLQKYLPETFQYAQAGGKRSVKRPLFGDMAAQARRIVTAASEAELSSRVKQSANTSELDALSKREAVLAAKRASDDSLAI